MIKNVFVFLFFSMFVVAQTKNVVVLDAQAGTPVSFATLQLKQADKIVYGTYADENGKAALADIGFDVLEVSCIGYKTAFFRKSELNESVKLFKEAIVLNEVVISKKAKKAKPITLGYSKAKKSVDVMAMQGAETVVFISNPTVEAMFIESFSFRGFTAKGYKFAFRIHFYRVDSSTKGPGEEIPHDDIVRYVDDSSERTVETNVAAYNLVMPEDGVYAGIEWLSCTDPDGVPAGAKDYKWYNSSVEYTTAENVVSYYRQRLDDGKWKKTAVAHNAAYGIKVVAY